MSRAAGIPTAWELTERLIRRLPEAQEHPDLSDPIAWYNRRYESDVTLPSLLEQLAPHASTRAKLLDSEIGEQTPTEAHRSLATLAERRYIQIFLTTNYDSLMEQALRDQGLNPLVISTAMAAKGTEPFHHLQNPVVVKLHGDILQPSSMRAIDIELEFYGDDIRLLLDRTLEEYGLLICGWSAEYDVALRDAIERRQSRRYPFWYAHRRTPGEQAQRLIARPEITPVPITDANSFFAELHHKVVARETFSLPSPEPTDMLVSELRLHLIEGSHPIVIDDLVAKQVERCYSTFQDREMFPYHVESDSPVLEHGYESLVVDVAVRYINATLPLSYLFSIGCGWSDHRYHDTWRRAIERIGQMPRNEARIHSSRLYDLRHLPMLLLLYVGSLSAIRRNNIEVIRLLCKESAPRLDSQDGRLPLLGYTRPAFLFGSTPQGRQLGSQFANALKQSHDSPYVIRSTPVSDALLAACREPLRELIPDDDDYEEYFDRTEILFNLIAADIVLAAKRSEQAPVAEPRAFGPWPGRFAWRRGYRNMPILAQTRLEFDRMTLYWQDVDKLLFDGDSDRKIRALEYIESERADWGRFGID